MLPKTEKEIEEIRDSQLKRGFDLIKKYIISRRLPEPEITPAKDGLKITFTDKHRQISYYELYILENGRVYCKAEMGGEEKSYGESIDAPELTPESILADFKKKFRLFV